MFKQIYGERYQPSTVEALRNQVLAGDFSSIPDIKVVSGDTLHGHHAAYGDGTIFLNEGLLQDTDKAAAYIIEELGHHYDGLFGAGDAKGDEGEMLRTMTGGQTVSAEEMQRLRTEKDIGTIEVDGKQIVVEFGFLSKVARSVKNAVSDIAKNVREDVKEFGNAAVDVLKFQGRLLTFPADFVVNGDDAVDRLEKSGKDALYSAMQSDVFTSVATAAVTLATGGTMTGPLLVLQEAAKQGVVAALQTAAVGYVKGEVIDFVAGKIAKETGSEWLGTAAGAFLDHLGKGKLDANLHSGIGQLSGEQVREYARPEIFNVASADIVRHVESNVDFASISESLGNWVDQGADWDKISAATSSIDRGLGESVKDIDWSKLLEKSKASAETMTSKFLDNVKDDKKPLQSLGNSMKNSVRDGFDLAKLPEMVKDASDSGLKALSSIASDRINKDVDFAPLREKLTGWAKAGADTDGLVALIKDAPAEISKSADSFSWEAMYGKTTDALNSQTLKQIDATVGYQPLGNGLRTWVEDGADVNGLEALYATVKDGVNSDIGKGLAGYDEAKIKAGGVFDRLALKGGELFSMDKLQNLLTAIDGPGANAPAAGKPESFAALMSHVADSFTNTIQTRMVAAAQNTDDPAVATALTRWINQGTAPEQLGEVLQGLTGPSETRGLPSEVIKASLTADILGGIDTGSLRKNFDQIRNASSSLSDISTRVAAFADKLPDSGYAASLSKSMEGITPQLDELLNKGEHYLNRVDDVKHSNENRAQQLNQVLQKSA